TLANNQDTPLAIGGIAAGGDFAQTNNCGSALASRSTCVIAVSFAPTAAGTRTGALTIAASAAASPVSVALSGTGVAPATLTASLSFGSQAVNTASAPRAATLTNNLDRPLTIAGITAGGDFSQTNTCGGALAARSSCAINVVFTPTTIEAKT